MLCATCIVTVPRSFTKEERKRLYNKFEPYFVKEFSRYVTWEHVICFPFPPDSDILHTAIQEIYDRELYYHLIRKTYYTKKELETVSFFQMGVRNPLELEGVDASRYNTQYTGGCPNCGRGKHLIGNLFIDRKFIRKYRIGMLEPNYFVSEEIRQLIEEAGLTGVSFEREVRDYKGRELPHRFYVMNIHHILPPLSPSTWLEDTKKRQMVSSCGHGTIYLRSDLQYEREKLEGAMDFNLTAEILNNDQIPALVVSAKTRKVFREHKVGWARYTPVLLTDGVVGTNPYLNPPPGLG